VELTAYGTTLAMNYVTAGDSFQAEGEYGEAQGRGAL